MNLIRIILQRKVSALATHVGNRDDGVLRHLTLNIKMVLLHVWPFHLGGNGVRDQRKIFAAPDVRVTLDVELDRSQDEGRLALQ